MEKNILKSTLVVAALTIAGYGGAKAYNTYAQSETGISNLLVQNVEALSQSNDNSPSETGPATIIICPNGGVGKYCHCENSMYCITIKCD